MHHTCLIIIHDPSMRLGPELNRGPLDQRISAVPVLLRVGLSTERIVTKGEVTIWRIVPAGVRPRVLCVW